MEETEKNYAEEGLKDLPVQTENLAFAQEEMILCAKCSRTNPPNRLNCFYCGAELEITEQQSRYLKPHLGRKLEAWEKGFNLIYLPQEQVFDNANASEIAKMLNLESESLQKTLGAKELLPLARLESEREAEIIQKRLRELGVETFVLSDEALAVEKPLRRLRSIDFSDSDKITLIFFNADEIALVAAEDLCLIVTGVIFERKVESLEKRKKKGENKILQATETATDEFLIDIYSRHDSIGYRILARGFDFSCLGAEKAILANDNLKKLVRKLQDFAPEAKLAENYLQVRESLTNIWETEERNDSQGLKRQSFGNFSLENITTVNNSAQFNKYSRLQWFLL